MSLLDSLRAHEGLRLQVYDDSNGKTIQRGSQVIGNPTIGFGTLISAPGGITQEEAQYLLNNRVQALVPKVDALVPGLLESDPTRFEVLVEMAFWIGPSGLASFKSMLTYISNGDYNGAADALLSSKLHSQGPARCEELAQTLRTGHA